MSDQMIKGTITKTDDDQHLVFGWANLPRPAAMKKAMAGFNGLGDTAPAGTVFDTEDSLEEFMRDMNEAYRAQFPAPASDPYGYRYIIATFPTSVIVSCGGMDDCDYMQHTYVVDGESILFSAGSPVEQMYVAKKIGALALSPEVSKMYDPEKLEKRQEELGDEWLTQYIAQAATGEIKTDLQDDAVPLVELEKAAYEFVLESRVGGADHETEMGKLVESFFATTEKYIAMGIPEDVAKTLNEGWFIGFKVEDESTWEGVKSGKYSMFSIGGRSKRTEVTE